MSDGGHWYKPDGSAFYTIKGANGKERNVTLRDARKINAVPSVTTVTKILKTSDALENYKLRQLYDAMLRVIPFRGESDDVYFTRLIAASREHVEKAASRGSKLHAAIENFVHGLPFDADWEPQVNKTVATLNQLGIDITRGVVEKSFAHPLGYGGKCDNHTDPEKSADALIIDFKSKERIDLKKKYGYAEQAMQIAAYREGLGIPKARGINVFVGCEDVQVLVHEWPEADLQAGWENFHDLLRIWQRLKNYRPLLKAA